MTPSANPTATPRAWASSITEETTSTSSETRAPLRQAPSPSNSSPKAPNAESTPQPHKTATSNENCPIRLPVLWRKIHRSDSTALQIETLFSVLSGVTKYLHNPHREPVSVFVPVVG